MISIILTALVLLFWSNTASAETTCTFNDLGDRTCTTVTQGVNIPGTSTGNVLNNSTFTPDASGDNFNEWSGLDHGHPSTSGTTIPGQNTSGGVVAFDGDPNESIYQDVDLVGDGHLTQSQINEGFTSTMSADVWFWNNVENTLTLKQTITASDGTVTTQTRNINDYDPNRSFNGGQWNNYTDSYTHNSNTQTDFTIRAEMYNETADVTYKDVHRGPDVDNIQLSITTDGTVTQGTSSSVFTPCFELNTCTSAGEDIANAIDLRTDDGRPIFDDLEYKVDNAVKNFEDLEEIRFVPVETMVEVEDDFGKIEEIKFEDFVEMRFTSFIVENNLVEEFKEELKVEGITEDEFFDELGGAMKEELGGDIMSDMKEFKEEEMPNDITTETRTEEIREEKIEEFNEEKTEDGDVNANTPEQPEETDTQETLQSNEEEGPNGPENENVSTKSEMDIDEKTERQAEKESADEIVEGETDISVKNKSVTVDAKVGSITEKVAKVIKKLEAKLKRVDDRLKATSYVLAVGLQSTQPDMSAYTNKRIYRNQKTIPGVIPNFFQDINILEQQQVYNNVSLAKYTDNDPLTVRRKQLIEIDAKKQKLMAEIAAIRSN